MRHSYRGSAPEFKACVSPAVDITMENYAGNRTDEWYFQMYGVPTKTDAHTGQTFHEQHRDVHAQHGTTPTTLSTEKT